MYEWWADEYFTGLTAAMIRGRDRRWWTIARSIARSPSWYARSVFRPVHSWFDPHYNDVTVQGDFFRQQLRVTKNSFNRIFNILGHRSVQQSSRLRDPLPPEKNSCLRTLSLGSYVSIGLSSNGIPCYRHKSLKTLKLCGIIIMTTSVRDERPLTRTELPALIVFTLHWQALLVTTLITIVWLGFSNLPVPRNH